MLVQHTVRPAARSRRIAVRWFFATLALVAFQIVSVLLFE